jgi:hypothetical protein
MLLLRSESGIAAPFGVSSTVPWFWIVEHVRVLLGLTLGRAVRTRYGENSQRIQV